MSFLSRRVADGESTSQVSLGIYEKALASTRDWSSFFAQAAEAGFSFVDLAVDDTPERASRLTWDAAQRAAVREAARAQDVQLGGLCLSLHRTIMLGGADVEMRKKGMEVFEQGIQLAADLGVGLVQVAGYFAFLEPPSPEARRYFLDAAAKATAIASRLGVQLGIENVDGHDITSITQAMEVVREIDSPWLQCYPDIGNLAFNGLDAAAELTAGEGHMLALHVKDVRPGEARRVAFGDGIADFDGSFAEIVRQGWSGRMMLEMWNDDAPDSTQRCAEARRFIEAKLLAAGIEVVPPVASIRRR